MRILITGATGFIGSALAAAFGERGHRVVACVHRAGAARLPAEVATLPVDYRHDTDPAVWIPRLAGVDVVINAVGILRESAHARFDALHHHAPRALFDACVQSRVRRVIQISALGADAEATSRYHRSKCAADDYLRATALDWTIVQPSVVFGANGASTRLFLALASLPVIPLVGRGMQRLQPIHIDDLVALVVTLAERKLALRQTLAAVGPAPVTLREMLVAYRESLGLGKALILPIPLALIRLAARVGDVVKGGALSSETLGMLLRHNTGSPRAVQTLLERPPRALTQFIPAERVAGLKFRAAWSWLRPLLSAVIAAVWIVAGVASWTHGRAEGLALLAVLGLSPAVAAGAFLAACGLNVALGAATLLAPGRRLWLAQLAVMAFYTAVLSWVAPQLWLDPFGPLVKNLPLAVVLVGLASLDGEA